MASRSCVSRGACGILLFGGRDEQPGVLRVADRGLGVEAEHGGQVQRVGADRERFLELPVDAEPFQGDGRPAQRRRGEVAGADGAGAVGAAVVDQQVGVGRGRSAGGAVGEPPEQDLAREVVERACPAADGDPPVAEVDVVEAEFADRLDVGGVHRGEDQAQLGPGSGGGLCRLVDVVLAQRLDDPLWGTGPP